MDPPLAMTLEPYNKVRDDHGFAPRNDVGTLQ